MYEQFKSRKQTSTFFPIEQQFLPKFRCLNLKILIGTGRWRNIPKEKKNMPHMSLWYLLSYIIFLKVVCRCEINIFLFVILDIQVIKK